MNGFFQEVATQGTYLKKVIAFYQNEGKKLIDDIAEEYQKKGMDRIILTGMGSSLYAMDTVRSYLTNNGIPTIAFSSFELSRFQFPHVTPNTLVVAVSQSGNSAEVVELVEKAKKITSVVGIFNNEESKIAQMVDFPLPIKGDKEVSVTSKTYELTMLIINILARKLVGKLDDNFWAEAEKTADWCCDWLDNWEANTTPMYEFAKDAVLYDLLANNTSLATARQLSLAYREGLHNCASVWEHADYAHGQYQSARMGEGYVAQMFFPSVEEGTKEMKMFNFILENGGKVMLYTPSDFPAGDRVYVVKMPNVCETLVPLAESVAAETLLAMLFGPEWKKSSPA